MSNSLPARLRLPAGGEAQMGVLSHITSATSSSSGDDCAGCVPSRRLPKDFTDESSKRSRLCSLYSAIGLIHTLGLLLQLTLTVLAFTVPVFERNVYGSLPDALRVNLGIDFNDSYNMIKLAKMAAQARLAARNLKHLLPLLFSVSIRIFVIFVHIFTLFRKGRGGEGEAEGERATERGGGLKIYICKRESSTI
eukprot:6201634-Pleurochrysis_carterae.AAC.1